MVEMVGVLVVRNYWLFACVLMLVTACSPLGESPSGPTLVALRPAVSQLLAAAEQDRLRQRWAQAELALERAVRIQGEAAQVWLAWAELALAQQQWGRARQFCQKALGLAQGQEALQGQVRQLLQRIQQAQPRPV